MSNDANEESVHMGRIEFEKMNIFVRVGDSAGMACVRQLHCRAK